jgi:peptide methionine sulfoxide reductase msrA/msrB
MKLFSTIIMGLLLLGMGGQAAVGSEEKIMDKKTIDTPDGTRNAVFAGGCFWCTESDFENLPGVLMVVSGYTGGTLANPTYEQVSGGGTGHVEAIQVVYEPDKVSFEQLLEVFWRGVDPTDNGGQFVDRGAQYRSAIFYADEEERKTAEKSRQALVDSGRFSKPVVTEILPLGPFYPAEAYHQDYYLKNPLRYQWYRSGSGRDQFLREVWGPESSKPVTSK